MRHHTKDKGDIGLGCVMADLLKHNIQVALPISEHLPFDLVAIHSGGDMLKVSVKYRVMTKHGGVMVRSLSVWNDQHGSDLLPGYGSVLLHPGYGIVAVGHNSADQGSDK